MLSAGVKPVVLLSAGVEASLSVGVALSVRKAARSSFMSGNQGDQARQASSVVGPRNVVSPSGEASREYMMRKNVAAVCGESLPALGSRKGGKRARTWEEAREKSELTRLRRPHLDVPICAR